MACSVASQFLNVHARRDPVDREGLAVRRSARAWLQVRVVCGVPCTLRASIRRAHQVRVQECPGGQDLALRVPEEWEVRQVWALHHRQARRTVHRADISSGAAAITATRSPKKVQ